MKKIYSTLTMLAMMVAALCFTACGGDDDGDDIDIGGKSYTLTVTTSGGDVFNNFPKIDGMDWLGHLTNESDKTNIWCMLSVSARYLNIYLEQNDLQVGDFYVGYDLGTPDLNFGITRAYDNTYRYESGSISVIKNDGSHFILKFDDYFARNVKSASRTIIVNGTLEVEKERLR